MIANRQSCAVLRVTYAALAALIALLVAGVVAGAHAGDPTHDPIRLVMPRTTHVRFEPKAQEPAQRHGGGERRLPSAQGLRAARSYASDRTGAVSFAVVNSEGAVRAKGANSLYSAASVIKAMLLAAETRQLKHEGSDIDQETDSLLRAMITASDNAAADAIYARVGEAGLYAAADRAGMTKFVVGGHWGSAQIAAGDMARFFADLDRQFPRRFREYAKGLLGSVIESQRWGIPAVAGNRWSVRFKGGWLPDHALVHQAAELRERDGSRSLAIVVLTDEQPSFEYGIETVQGVATRLLSRDGRP